MIKYFVLFISALITLSCEKGHEIKADFGEEVAVEAVEDVLSKASQDLDPTKAQVGQSVTRTVNLRVENSERFRPTFWDRQTLIDKTDTTDKYALHLKIEEKDLSVDPPEERTYEDDIVFKKVAVTPQMFSELASVSIDGSQKDAKASAASNKPVATKYYNLKYSQDKVSAPEAIQKKPNCLGFQDCKINVHHLEYDEVNWYKDGALKRIRWTYEISSEVPYLGGVTTVCAAQQIPYESIQVYVRNCRYVVDFNF